MISKIEKNAFSLIEIAIVFAVLSIFSAVAIPTFNSVRKRAITTVARETIKQIKKELRQITYMELKNSQIQILMVMNWKLKI